MTSKNESKLLTLESIINVKFQGIMLCSTTKNEQKCFKQKTSKFTNIVAYLALLYS